MSCGSSSSEDDSSLHSSPSSSSSMGSEGSSRCYSSLDNGLGIWLPPGVDPGEEPLMKCSLLSLAGSKMVAVISGSFLG
jgi:hypothetical protein